MTKEVNGYTFVLRNWVSSVRDEGRTLPLARGLANDPNPVPTWFAAPKSEQCRKHRVVSQPVDVDVPRKSADDREHMFRGSLFSFTHWVKHKNRSKAPVSLPQTAIRVIQLPNLG